MLMIQLISGFMVGIEFVWTEAMILDLGFFRLIFYYGDDPEGFAG